jgi:hypothetical protein
MKRGHGGWLRLRVSAFGDFREPVTLSLTSGLRQGRAVELHQLDRINRICRIHRIELQEPPSKGSIL